MKTTKPSVLVRFKMDLDESSKKRLKNNLNTQPGILNVAPSQGISNLIFVEYDALQTSLLQISKAVKGIDETAFLVGM